MKPFAAKIAISVDHGPQRTASKNLPDAQAGRILGLGQGEILVKASARLDLPDHLKLFAESVVFNGDHAQKGHTVARIRPDGLGGKPGELYGFDYPPPCAHGDQ